MCEGFTQDDAPVTFTWRAIDDTRCLNDDTFVILPTCVVNDAGETSNSGCLRMIWERHMSTQRGQFGTLSDIRKDHVPSAPTSVPAAPRDVWTPGKTMTITELQKAVVERDRVVPSSLDDDLMRM
jgi:hypothetical protein